MEQKNVKPNLEVKKISYPQEYLAASQESLGRSAQASVSEAAQLHQSALEHYTKFDYKKAYAGFIKAYHLMKSTKKTDFLPDKLFYANIIILLALSANELIQKEWTLLIYAKKNFKEKSITSDELSAQVIKSSIIIRGHAKQALRYLNEIPPLLSKLNQYEQQRYFLCKARHLSAESRLRREVSDSYSDSDNMDLIMARDCYLKSLKLTPRNSRAHANTIDYCLEDLPCDFLTGELGLFVKDTVPQFCIPSESFLEEYKRIAASQPLIITEDPFEEIFIKASSLLREAQESLKISSSQSLKKYQSLIELLKSEVQELYDFNKDSILPSLISAESLIEKHLEESLIRVEINYGKKFIDYESEYIKLQADLEEIAEFQAVLIALKTFKKEEKINPNYAKLVEGLVSEIKGNFQRYNTDSDGKAHFRKAHDLLAELAKKSPTPLLLQHLSQVCLALGEYDEALAHCRTFSEHLKIQKGSNTSQMEKMQALKEKIVLIKKFYGILQLVGDAIDNILRATISLEQFSAEINSQLAAPDDSKDIRKLVETTNRSATAAVNTAKHKINSTKSNFELMENKLAEARKSGYDIELIKMELEFKNIARKFNDIDPAQIDKQVNAILTATELLKQQIKNSELVQQSSENVVSQVQSPNKKLAGKSNTPKPVKKPKSNKTKKLERALEEKKLRKARAEGNKASLKKNPEEQQEVKTRRNSMASEHPIAPGADSLGELNDILPEAKSVNNDKQTPLELSQATPSNDATYSKLPDEFTSIDLKEILSKDREAALNELVDLIEDAKESKIKFNTSLILRGTIIIEFAVYLLLKKSFKTGDMDNIADLVNIEEVAKFNKLVTNKHGFKSDSSGKGFYGFNKENGQIKTDIMVTYPGYNHKMLNPFMLTRLKMAVSRDKQGILHFHLDKATKKHLNLWITRKTFPVEIPLAANKDGSAQHFIARLMKYLSKCQGILTVRFYRPEGAKYILLTPSEAEFYLKQYFKEVFETGTDSYQKHHYASMVKAISMNRFSDPVCRDLISYLCAALLQIRRPTLGEAVVAAASKNMATALQQYFKHNDAYAYSFSVVINLLARKDIAELADADNIESLVKFIGNHAPSASTPFFAGKGKRVGLREAKTECQASPAKQKVSPPPLGSGTSGISPDISLSELEPPSLGGNHSSSNS